MPEENKYNTPDEESAKKNSVDTDSQGTDAADLNGLTNAEDDAVVSPLDYTSENNSVDSLPYSHTSEDGDQLAISIPSTDEPRDDIDNTKTDVSADTSGFAAAILKEAPPYDEKKPRRIDERFDFIELLIFTLATVFVLTSFVFRHSIVDGDSMQNTLQDGEVLIISNLFYTPQRYDIVVVEDHSTGLDHPIVKRVIATEGETVRITSEGKIFVDGEEIEDYFVFTDAGDFDGDGEDNYTYSPMEYTVPEGEIFVLGDHRNDSYDSRKFGSVDSDTVLGKVLFRIYPFNRFGSVYGNTED